MTFPSSGNTTVKTGSKSTNAIVLTLSGPLSGPAANNIALYHLYAGRRVKKTVKYDRVIKLKSATSDLVKNTGTLRTRTALNLSPLMQLRVSTAGLLDPSGRALDGDHDGQPGGDLLANLSKKLVTILRPSVSSRLS